MSETKKKLERRFNTWRQSPTFETGLPLLEELLTHLENAGHKPIPPPHRRHLILNILNLVLNYDRGGVINRIPVEKERSIRRMIGDADKLIRALRSGGFDSSGVESDRAALIEVVSESLPPTPHNIARTRDFNLGVVSAMLGDSGFTPAEGVYLLRDMFAIIGGAVATLFTSPDSRGIFSDTGGRIVARTYHGDLPSPLASHRSKTTRKFSTVFR